MVPYIDRWLLNHWSTRKSPPCLFLSTSKPCMAGLLPWGRRRAGIALWGLGLHGCALPALDGPLGSAFPGSLPARGALRQPTTHPRGDRGGADGAAGLLCWGREPHHTPEKAPRRVRAPRKTWRKRKRRGGRGEEEDCIQVKDEERRERC